MEKKRNKKFFKNVKQFYKELKEENTKTVRVNTLEKKEKKTVKKYTKSDIKKCEEYPLHKSLNDFYKNRNKYNSEYEI